MTRTRKEGDKTVGSDKKTRGGKGKFSGIPSRKSLRKRNAPRKIVIWLSTLQWWGGGIYIFKE